MRVIGGTARSLPLKTPEGMDTRPTTDRIKETLFNMIQYELPGCVFMDLFSGSGGIGIEALSRGAEKAYFVESSSRAIACIKQNLTFTKLQERGIVLKQDVCGALTGIADRQEMKGVDIIFMDPPYGQDYEKKVLAVLAGMSYVTNDTLIIAEAALKADFSWVSELGFCQIREKCYKTNKHIFIKRTFSA
ncbi:MAG: 16S rRNA (guanine(966)-N(2))-methyltransferase RsmD [Lachnospiraceae bacterium]|nr:16S rRNA (guanine(966)-N(2))-methyltransferase RsmD [Lachnospiraceae bacterium]